MAVDTNINQFKPGRAIGDLDLNYFGGEHVISCRYNPEGTGNLKAGEAVAIVDLGADDVAGPPIVGKRATDLIATFGIVRRSLKQAEFKPGDIVEIAVSDAVIWMKAAAALARGAKVSAVQATTGSVQAVGTKSYLGYLLDKAAQGDIVRVMIKADAVTAGS
jgi:hypothetical protein